MHERNYLLEALAQSRSRQSWNDRLEHWEKPASDSEEAIIQRAATMVRGAMTDNQWCSTKGIRILPQGSYHNNTNVRQESDMDLRAVHPAIYIDYAADVNRQAAHSALGYHNLGETYDQGVQRMRTEIVRQLGGRFGIDHVDDSGNKAVRLKSIPGSRADVDIVPCFVLQHVFLQASRRPPFLRPETIGHRRSCLLRRADLQVSPAQHRTLPASQYTARSGGTLPATRTRQFLPRPA
jgi:hypothetical protein